MSFLTHMSEIDKLIGIDGLLAPGSGISGGDIILLKGGPGSGKTTLGLQILSRYVEQLDASTAQNQKAIFISLESDPHSNIEKVIRDFNFFINNRQSLAELSDAAFNSIFDMINEDENLKNIVTKIKSAIEPSVKIPGLILPGIYGKISDETLETLLGFIVDFSFGLIRKHKKKKQIKYDKEVEKDKNIAGVIFIDSINALFALSEKKLAEAEAHFNPRLILNNLCEGIRRHFKNYVIIMSSEFHSMESWIPSGMAESFLCDVEILLDSEPITVPIDFEANRYGSTGYNIYKIIEAEKSSEGLRLENRSFIRVTKSKKSQNQSRRCAYEVIAGEGLKFYETYPGDGHINLFTENNQQQQVINDFFKKDIPHLYPALRYEHFDRHSLQRTFSTQRRFNYIPKRTDLHLSSFDNYWISWYTELYWKWAINDILKKNIHSGRDKQKEFHQVLNLIHENINRKTPLRDELSAGIKKELKIEDDDITNEILKEIIRIITSKDYQLCLRCSMGLSVIIEKLVKKNKNYRNSFILLLKRILECEKNDVEDVINTIEQENNDRLKNIINILNLKNDRSFLKCQFPIIKGKFEEWPLDFKNKAHYDKIIDGLQSILRITDCLWKLKFHGFIASLKMNPFFEELSKKEDLEIKLNNLVLFIDAHLAMYIGKFIITDEIINNLKKNFCNNHTDEALDIIVSVYHEIIIHRGAFSLLCEIPESGLRLYGERRSKIIEELEQIHQESDRPIHRPEFLFSLKKDDSYISVPYDANVSFMVYRTDLLETIRTKIVTEKLDYSGELLNIYRDETSIMKELFPEIYISNHLNRDQIIKNLAINIQNSDYIINTWEEMIALLKTASIKKKYFFLIENQIFDTIMTTIMEFVWNCGGDLIISPIYNIDKPEETKMTLFLTYYLLGMMFYYNIIPFNSTFDLKYIEQNFSNNSKQNSKTQDWVFARHWYSTLIDMLTLTKNRDRNNTYMENFYWRNPGAKLQIMPIPISLDRYLSEGDDAIHYCSWGDWHLAIIKGSENIELGIDLINNWMSSQKINERADACAALPTVEDFYTLYGESKCINLPQRTKESMPGITYKQMREKFFKYAKSRSQIFDYQHCIRELHSLYKFTQMLAMNGIEKGGIDIEDWLRLKEKINLAFDAILKFRNRQFMVQ